MTTSTSADRSRAAAIERADGGAHGDTDATGTTDHATRGLSRTTRYRYLIPLVEQAETPVTIDQFVDPMLYWEHEITEGDSTKSWGDVHEELFVVDLPVLDRAGVIDFDRASGVVVTDSE